MTMTFEEWLRFECFKPPTKEAYDLAKGAWNKAIEEAEDAVWNSECGDCDAGHGAQGSAAEAVNNLAT